jgi:tetratricopeptide (TPR) repeat protein
VRRLQALLASVVDVPERLRARALRVLAGSAQAVFDFELADPNYEKSLRIFSDLGETRGVALLQLRLSTRAYGRSDPERARELAEASYDASRDRFPLIESQTTLMLGGFALRDGDVEEAARLMERSRTLASRLGWSWWEAQALGGLSEVARARGDLEEAERLARHGLSIDVEQEQRGSAMRTLVGLARLALGRRDLERAGLLWGAASAEGEGMPNWETFRTRLGDGLPEERAPSFLAAYERGRQLDVWDAAAIALGELEPPQTVP